MFVHQENLFLNENQISGSLPSALFEMKRLEVLDLTNNALSSSVPAEISQLSHLRELSVIFVSADTGVHWTIFLIILLSCLSLLLSVQRACVWP